MKAPENNDGRGPCAMTEKPRRPWFQIHLSTAIVLMFVAGLLLRANMLPSVSRGDDPARADWYYGWPYPLLIVAQDGSRTAKLWLTESLYFDIPIALAVVVVPAILIE